ncbi:transglutaminase domain-containing protein [Candidatus Daviesbacteria bacterium]|nr:transglutaminase domain-containing protein [Candidatus Daviesbacteria bacterium]
MLKRIAISFFLLLGLTLVPKINAAEEPDFATSYDVVFDVGIDGVTTVTEKINLKNLTSQYYANEFKLNLGASQVYDLKAFDSGGVMKVDSDQKDNSTTIKVRFNQQVAGIGKSVPWTLQFRTKDFAQNLGKIWEVRAPKVSSSANLANYNLTVSVPNQFGEPTLVNPTPKSQTSSADKIFLTFEKSQLLDSGISAIFGSSQLFDFDLTYHLQNNNLISILTNIAIPSDTSYQDVIIQRIDPQPINVTLDDDGNYLAWFRLSRGQKLDVKVSGSAKLYAFSKVKNPTLDAKLRDKLTKPDKYWEKDHPQIQAELMEILGDNQTLDPAEKIRLIYQYTVNSLKYDPSRLSDSNIERLGAATVLTYPTKAVCMEFTDLFIALARAAGIPARELNGFAYTNNIDLRPLSLNKDVLHSWPEYWDEQRGWVMVDPTWENTTGGIDYFNKLDLNHFVFVTKGFSSEGPIPAGSYNMDNNSHDVKVELSQNDFLGKPQLDVQIDSPNPIWAGFPGQIKVKVSNMGNAFYPAGKLSVVSNRLIFLNLDNLNMGPIPPFGTATFNLNIRTKSLFDSFNDQVIFLVGSQNYTKDLVIRPFVIFNTVPLVAIGIVFLIGLIYFAVLGVHIYKARFLPKHKKKTN